MRIASELKFWLISTKCQFLILVSSLNRKIFLQIKDNLYFIFKKNLFIHYNFKGGNTCGFNNLNRFATIKVLKLQPIKDVQDSGVPGTSELESNVIASDINKVPDPVIIDTEKPKQDPGKILVVPENPVIQETNILKPVSDTPQTIPKPVPEPINVVPPISHSSVKPISIPVKPIPGPVQTDKIKVPEPINIVPPTSPSSVKPISIPVKPISCTVHPIFGPIQPKQKCYYLPLKCHCRPLPCYSRPLPCFPRPLLYVLRPFPGCSKPTEVTPLFKIVERIIVNKKF